MKYKRSKNRICLNCSSNITYIHKDGREQWYNYKDNWKLINP